MGGHQRIGKSSHKIIEWGEHKRIGRNVHERIGWGDTKKFEVVDTKQIGREDRNNWEGDRKNCEGDRNNWERQNEFGKVDTDR